MLRLRSGAIALTGLGLALTATSAQAAEAPPFVQAPAAPEPSSPILAAMFSTTVQLPEGRGIAKALLELGVNTHDAAEAAKLAAGHLGEGKGGCAAKIEISQSTESGVRTVRRLVLSSAAGDAVIERRGDTLSLVPAGDLRATPARIA